MVRAHLVTATPGHCSGTLCRVSPRKTWLDSRIDVFMDETNRLGLTCPREPIGQEIQARVNTVAHAMRVTEATARREFTDEMIREMAQRMASELEAEKPGADPLTLPPTHVISTALAGRTSAGLAIAGQLAMTAGMPYFDNDSFDRVHQPIATICHWGILMERSASRPGLVAVPEALIHRTLRELGKAIHHLEEGVVPTDGGDPHVLREALVDNVSKLKAEL
jgi:hypothetical protein